MNTVTRDRLLKIQQWRETYGPGSNVVLPAEEAEELARIALSSLETEPVSFDALRDAVAEVSGGAAMEWSDIYKGHQAVPFINFNSLARIVDKYRAAPPASVSVPTFDEWLEIRGNKPLGWVKDAMRESYDACRAAMLDNRATVESRNHAACSPKNGLKCAAARQGSQPVSNRDELPEEKGSSLQLRNLIRQRHAEWSEKTFGNVGPVGPLKHLSKEALEAAAEPDDLSEWADMQFLLWDAQRRAGISDGEITAAMEEKLKVNMARQWPEPKDGEPRMHIKEAGNSPVIPDGYVVVPKRLTAENGAKGVMIGEFSETKFINCTECFGDDECETCDGSGRIEISVPVSWTNIKAIWAKGVEHFAAAPKQETL